MQIKKEKGKTIKKSSDDQSRNAKNRDIRVRRIEESL